MRHGSLFSGIGGFDLAAQWMGWDNVFHVEWNPWCRKVLEHHFPNSQSFTDVKQFDGSAWRGRVDIISGGFPCQPYSSAGKRLGKDDERHLWPEMLRVIREAAPAYVVGENVRGLTNWNGGVVFEEVCADLEAAGYEVWTGILPAAGVGAPHRRDRVWFVAYANGRSDLRTPGRDAGTSASEGVPERDKVRIPDQSGDVWDATDTACSISERTWNARPGWDGFTDNGRDGHAADTNCRGLERAVEVGRDGVNVERQSQFGHAADTDGTGLKKRIAAAESGEPRFGAWHGGADAGNADGQVSITVGTLRQCGNESAGIGGQSSWDRFPTQSPVCGGDDGLPRELDGITFSKWRNESIKAYGNAIVPQVAYEIFKAIQQTHEN